MSNISQIVKDLLRNDDVENYESPEAVAESVTSELEGKMEITPNDAAIIGEVCEEWYASEQ
jgi:hypothetical protein